MAYLILPTVRLQAKDWAEWFAATHFPPVNSNKCQVLNTSLDLTSPEKTHGRAWESMTNPFHWKFFSWDICIHVSMMTISQAPLQSTQLLSRWSRRPGRPRSEMSSKVLDSQRASQMELNMTSVSLTVHSLPVWIFENQRSEDSRRNRERRFTTPLL